MHFHTWSTGFELFCWTRSNYYTAYNIVDHTYDVVVVGAGGSGLRATFGMGAAAGMTEGGILVEDDLGVGGDELALPGHNQRVDLDQLGVLRDQPGIDLADAGFVFARGLNEAAGGRVDNGCNAAGLRVKSVFDWHAGR